jgi:thioredoxin 2
LIMADVKLENTGVIVRCGQCGKSNRLRFESLDKSTRCGQCRADLPRPGVPVEVPSDDVFATLTRESALPVLVDFWAECLIAKVDTEALPDVAARFGIQSIPTMTLFHRGRELSRTAGARPAAAIVSFVEQALAQHAR